VDINMEEEKIKIGDQIQVYPKGDAYEGAMVAYGKVVYADDSYYNCYEIEDYGTFCDDEYDIVLISIANPFFKKKYLGHDTEELLKGKEQDDYKFSLNEIRKIIREVLMESYTGVFGLAPAMQQNMDWSRTNIPKTGMFGPETQEQTEEFNDNINRELYNKVNFDDNTWSRKSSPNRSMYTEEELSELFPNCATIGGEALPHKPKKAVYDNEDRKDQVMIQRKATEK